MSQNLQRISALRTHSYRISFQPLPLNSSPPSTQYFQILTLPSQTVVHSGGRQVTRMAKSDTSARASSAPTPTSISLERQHGTTASLFSILIKMPKVWERRTQWKSTRSGARTTLTERRRHHTFLAETMQVLYPLSRATGPALSDRIIRINTV